MNALKTTSTVKIQLASRIPFCSKFHAINTPVLKLDPSSYPSPYQPKYYQILIDPKTFKQSCARG